MAACPETRCSWSACRCRELDRIAAFGEDAVERPVQTDQIAVERRGDHVVDADGRGVAQNGHRIFQGDRLAAVGALVEKQLVDFAARLTAIAAQPLDDPLQCVGLDGHALRAGGTFDQAFQCGVVVHVTGQGGQHGLGFREGAQIGARRQVARLDDNERIAGAGRHEILESGGRFLSRRPDADHAPATHHGHRAEFVREPRRILLQRVAGDVDDAERVLEVLADGLGQRHGPLRNQPVVVAVHDDAPDPRIRLLQERFDLAGFDLHRASIAWAALR